MNPWEKLKPPSKPQVIEEVGFRRASREANKIPYKGKLETARKREKTRVHVLARTFLTNIRRGLKILDSYFDAHEFYKDLVRIYYDENEIKRVHKRLVRLEEAVNTIVEEYVQKIIGSDDPDEMRKWRRVAQGKISTFIKRVSDDFIFIIEMYRYVRSLPSIDLSLPTFLVAGPPNTGKSTLVNKLSSARTKVASYPFTTKEIHVGHIEVGYMKGQIIDTPGLLDREMSERNEIELKAITALRHLRGPIIFMFDPTNSAYYPPQRQLNIFREIQNLFKDKDFIAVINKMDEASMENILVIEKQLNTEPFKISLVTDEGLDALRGLIANNIQRLYLDSSKR